MKRVTETRRSDYYESSARVLTCTMFLLYPLSLIVTELVSGRVFEGSWLMLSIAASGVAAVWVSPKTIPKIKWNAARLRIASLGRIRGSSIPSIVVAFIFSALVFSFFGWHSDRVSLGASLSGVLRAVWLLLALSVVSSSERRKMGFLILTISLAYIDESRTYFGLAFIIVAATSIYVRSLFLVGFVMLMSLAAVRMSESVSVFGAIAYGVLGETINATHSFRQLLNVEPAAYQSLIHFGNLTLSSIASPVLILLDLIIDTGNLSLLVPAQMVVSQLSQDLNPMGGWYIANDMVIFGKFAHLICFIFVYINYNLVRILLNSEFPIGSFLFILFAKTNVLIFWNMVIYLVVINAALSVLRGRKR